MTHERCCFLTLTYNDENIPANGSLSRPHLQKFIKDVKNDLRKFGLPQLRYFAVGEYGEKTERPHYHLNVFGYGRELAPFIEDRWRFGYHQIGDFNYKTAQYVAKYVVKGLTWKGHRRLAGRAAEFQTCSKHPAIGVPALEQIVKQIENVPDEELPTQFRFDGKKWPFGRVMRKAMFRISGRDEEKAETTQRWIDEQQKELLPLLEIEIDEGKIATTSAISASLTKQRRMSLERRVQLKDMGKTGREL
jgi:hypothetical protein